MRFVSTERRESKKPAFETNVELFEPAHPADRCLAYLGDLAILFLSALALSWVCSLTPIAGLSFILYLTAETGTGPLVLGCLKAVAAFTYFSAFQAGRGSTIGMNLMRIALTTREGGRLGFTRVLGRNVVFTAGVALCAVVLSYGLDFPFSASAGALIGAAILSLPVLFTRDALAMHDMAAYAHVERVSYAKKSA